MQWRATLATLIAVLLLSVSCSASACEISCDLMARGSGCHHAAGATTVAAMHHCDEMTKQGSGSIAPVQPCMHAVCKTLPPAVASDRVGIAPERLAAPLAILVSMLAVAPPHGSLAAPMAGAPPLRAPLLVSLQTTLRV